MSWYPTYRQLLKVLKTLPDEQLDQTVTILDQGSELIPLNIKEPYYTTDETEDRLDSGHFVLKLAGL